MDQNSPDKREPKSEVIDLNQEFRLFNPSLLRAIPGSLLTNIQWIQHRFEKQGRRLRLGTDEFAFEMELTLSEASEDPLAFDPFNSDSGYNVTMEDLHPEKRKEKLEKLESERNEKVNAESQNGRPVLSVYFLGSEKPKEVFQGLRLVVSFPNGLSFESTPDLGGLWDVTFKHFYPIDIGPLTQVNYMGRGAFLQLPLDIERLNEITARFVLAPKENHAKE